MSGIQCDFERNLDPAAETVSQRATVELPRLWLPLLASAHESLPSKPDLPATLAAQLKSATKSAPFGDKAYSSPIEIAASVLGPCLLTCMALSPAALSLYLARNEPEHLAPRDGHVLVQDDLFIHTLKKIDASTGPSPGTWDL